MSSTIKCPSCGNEFPLQDAMTDEMKNELEQQKELLRKQMTDYIKSKEEDAAKREEQWRKEAAQREQVLQKQFEENARKQVQQTEEAIRKSLSSDFEHRMKLMQQNLSENEAKLKAARDKELEYLQKEKQLKEKEAELEIQVQKKMMEERERMKEQLKKEEQEKMQLKEQEHQLRVKEMEKQMEAQKKMIDEMKRKAEQGSMQLQGEAQEVLLEDLLRATFPFDMVNEVGKGVRGADCIMTVRNNLGNEAGSIIFESKRTKDFSNDWIEKLKADMRSQGADMAVIVTQAFPKDMDRFGEREGVYICSFQEVRGVTLLLRNALLKIYEVRKTGENKGDKMAMLYDYLTGHEFGEQWKAIREGFMQMRVSIQNERVAMEKLWKQREKQLEKILLNAAHIQGSVEGIAGADNVNLNLLDEGFESAE